jgi:hypothetical protein
MYISSRLAASPAFGPLAAGTALLRGWLLLLLLAVAVGSGRLWLLWWETDY